MRGQTVQALCGDSMTDHPQKQPWGLIRLGKYASAMLPIAGVIGMLVTAGIQLKDMQNSIQSLVDDSATQKASSVELSEDLKTLQSSLAVTVNTLSKVVDTQSQNVAALNEIRGDKDHDPTPAIQFTRTGHSIGNGVIGGFVPMEFTYFKMRDCKAPKLDLHFINGAGLRHRFINVSVVGADGRGVNSEVSPTQKQTIKYVARIPDDDGVTVGKASGWVEVSYPDECPAVETVPSPVLTFNILPNEK